MRRQSRAPRGFVALNVSRGLSRLEAPVLIIDGMSVMVPRVGLRLQARFDIVIPEWRFPPVLAVS